MVWCLIELFVEAAFFCLSFVVTIHSSRRVQVFLHVNAKNKQHDAQRNACCCDPPLATARNLGVAAPLPAFVAVGQVAGGAGGHEVTEVIRFRHPVADLVFDVAEGYWEMVCVPRAHHARLPTGERQLRVAVVASSSSFLKNLAVRVRRQFWTTFTHGSEKRGGRGRKGGGRYRAQGVTPPLPHFLQPPDKGDSQF